MKPKNKKVSDMTNMRTWLMVAALAAVFGFAGVSRAADRIWTGQGTDGNWSTAGNWGGTAPVANDALAFGGSARLANINDLAADLRLNSITFLSGAGAFNLSGNRIALGGDITNRSTSVQTAGMSLALQQETVFIITAATGNLTVTGTVSGAYGLTKKGPGVMSLSPLAVNTYTGDTVVRSGQLGVNWQYVPGTANPLSASSGLVLGSGVFSLFGSAGSNSQTFDGASLQTGASVLQLNQGAGSGGSLTVSLGPLTRDSGATLNIALTHEGPKNLSCASWAVGQTITDSGVAYSTHYTGSSTATPPAAGNDWAAFNGTTVIATTYTPSTPSNLTANADVATGTDTILSNDTAVTTIRFGQAEARTITVASGKTLTTGGILVSSTVGNNLSSITNGTLRSAATVADRDLVIINNDTSSSLAIGSVIANAAAGTTGLTKSGPGALSLTATNTYTGPSVINAGKISVSSVSAKTVAQPLGKGDIVLSGGTLLLTPGGNLLPTDKNLILREGAVSTVEINTATTGQKGINGSGRITGVGDLIVNAGAGTAKDSRLIMSGSNDFTGTLTINSGVLQVNDNPPGKDVSVNVNGGTLRLIPALSNVTNRWALGALQGNGILQGGYLANSLTIFSVGTRNESTTFSGRIENYNSGKAALAKVGTATLTLTGVNTYSGPTTVEAGTLKIGINDALPTASAVTVFEGAVLDVGATTNAPPSISGDGTLRMSGTGMLNVSGTLNVTNMTLEVTDVALLPKETRVIATGSPVTAPFKTTNIAGTWKMSYTSTEARLVYLGGTMIRIF